MDLADEHATLQLGARLAACVGEGVRMYLRGELGSGKTTLVRGMLATLGYQGRVRSPTYALVELYVLSRLKFYHFDFYRFNDPSEWDAAGFRDCFDGSPACVVEWPERAGHLLPPPDLEISLRYSGPGRRAEMRAFSAAAAACLAGC